MSVVPAALAGLHGEVSVHPTPEALAKAAATIIERASAAAAAQLEPFSIALSGGNTPRTLHELLAAPPHREAIEWAAWSVFFGDERAVPPDDPASNYGMAHETLLSRVPIDQARVHRMRADHPDLDLAADEYAVILHGDLPEGPGGAPRLDCVLLGLGEDGHTASLFPGTPALSVRDRWVTRGRAANPPYERLTLTYPTLNAAALVVFLVAGASKRDAVRAAAAGTAPAAGVRPRDGSVVWLLDAAAAGTS